MGAKAVLLAAAYSLIMLGLASLLTGCAEVRTIYHACKDGNCR